jgi:DNA polymerase sigma
MTHTEEKIATAEARIKELQLLIEHWKKEGNK